jgi:tRNA (guanine37-N1)-methyltransferase
VHGTGVAGALLDFALTDAMALWGVSSVALGTNRANKRAIRFYRNHGFKKVGRRTFDVGGRSHSDFVYVRDLTQFPPR